MEDKRQNGRGESAKTQEKRREDKRCEETRWEEKRREEEEQDSGAGKKGGCSGFHQPFARCGRTCLSPLGHKSFLGNHRIYDRMHLLYVSAKA